MFLEEVSADEPFPLSLVLSRGLTVVAGLGPKHRSWLASAVADAMAGRGTPLWGVAQVVNMRVDLGDPLVVRSTVGVDPVIGPEIWRSRGGVGGRWSDDLWPSSSLGTEAAADVGRAHSPDDLRVAVAAAPQAPPSGEGRAPVPEPVAEAAAGRKRRWWRHPADPPTPQEASASEPLAGSRVELLPVRVDERPEVPPPVAVADPAPPPILSEPGPPVPSPLQVPPRRVASVPADQRNEAPAPPARPSVLDAPAPGDPGPHPGPLVLPPAPSPTPAPQPLDPRFERRVADVAQAVVDRQAHLAACRAAVAAIVVPVAPDTAPVAAALAELQRRLAEEAATVAEARRLAGLWAEAQSGIERATMALAPAWLVEAVRRQRNQAGREVAEAEAELAAPPPPDPELVGQVEAAHAEVLRLEAQGGPRRRLLTAREEEANLLAQVGVADHASLAPLLGGSRQLADAGDRLGRARSAAAEAESAWAELQAPRDDAAAAAAGSRLAAVWSEVVGFLGHQPTDVLAALIARSQRGTPVTTAGSALAAAVRAVGVEPPGNLDALSAAARAWLDRAGERAAAVDAAVAAGHRAADELRRAEEAVADAQEEHAEAVASLGAATASAAARRAAAEAAHQHASARWRQEVDAVQTAHARALEEWSAKVAAYDHWAASRHEAEAMYERRVAGHHQAVAAHEQAQREALSAAQRQADEAWQAAVVALEAEFDRCHAARAEWERQRAEAEAAWQAEVAAVAAERRRLEEERSAALAALGAWEERHAPAPSLPELLTMLRKRVAENHTAGPAGAVPLVIDDALASLPLEVVPVLFGELAEAAASIQVIYLTDEPDVVAMARSLGTATITTVEAPAT